jgi:hypothetical protein
MLAQAFAGLALKTVRASVDHGG